MYYSLWDDQCYRQSGVGQNSKTKKELKEAFLAYISPDFDEDDRQEDFKAWKKESIEELAHFWGFTIQKTKAKTIEI